MVNAELSKYGFDPETCILKNESLLPTSMTKPDCAQHRTEMINVIKKVISEYNANKTDEDERITWNETIDRIEVMPEHTVILCIDDVGVHQQKEHRNGDNVKSGYTKDARTGKKVLETTVVYIRTKEGHYRLRASSVRDAIKIALAYMLKNGFLADRELMIFSDGAGNIRSVVEETFSFRPYSLNLDWFHLQKHCYESLTMALTGGKENKERNEAIRHKFNKIIFAGNVDEAKKYLDSLSLSMVKNKSKIKEIQDYLERKREYIYVYAIRKGLNIVNSSNQGEKSNDMVIAGRCKHNGMSWTHNGLRGMGATNLLRLNEEELWYTENVLTFKPVPHSINVQKQYQQCG